MRIVSFLARRGIRDAGRLLVIAAVIWGWLQLLTAGVDALR